MHTVSHVELLTHTNEILARVQDGETINVTNNGEVAATLIPPSLSPFDQLLFSGNVRPAGIGTVDFRLLERVRVDQSSREILADLREDQ